MLGIQPDEAPEARLDEFQVARERIAELLSQAPNDAVALRYQEWLQEFDLALEALRGENDRRLQQSQLPAAPPVPLVAEEAAPPAAPESEAPPEPRAAPIPELTKEPRTGGIGRYLLYLVLFLLIGGSGGGWLYFHLEAEREVERRTEMAELETHGAKLVESRRWEDAKRAYQRIEALDPGSEVALYGLRSIESGMREEQEQFVGYWSGEAQAALEAGRLDDAAEAAAKVIERYPDEAGVLALQARIESARILQLRESLTKKVREAVEARDWATANEALAGIEAKLPGDGLLRVLGREIEEARERQARERERARQLAAAARLRDQGSFDPMVLEWMREAISLAPDDPEIQAFYEKVASYNRTLRVPQDVPTLAEALAEARDRDRVVLAEGVHVAGLVVSTAVQIEGAGEGKTILESQANEAPVLTFGPRAKGATVSGLVFRPTGFEPDESRYPAVQLRGAEVSFSDCVFESASGHGLEVIEGGRGEAIRCGFKGNGWDGAAARGAGSRLVVRESLAEGNFGHGFEVWDGALLSLRDSVSRRNSRAGVLVDSVVDGIEIIGNEIFGNREFGLVLAAGSSGSVRDNSCHSNLRGGIVVRFPAMSMVVGKNRIEKNDGPGLLLEQGLREDIYQDNTVGSNREGNLVSGVRFDESE